LLLAAQVPSAGTILISDSNFTVDIRSRCGWHLRPPIGLRRDSLQTETGTMSLGLIVVIVLIIFLLGGFSGRFGGYGYGFGHGGVGIIGTILIIVVVLMLLGRI
jgi:hypothetical protein